MGGNLRNSGNAGPFLPELQERPFEYQVELSRGILHKTNI